MLDEAEYQKEYDKAAAELEAAANGATTARGEDGKFVAVEKEPKETPETPEPEKQEPESKSKPVEADPLAEIREKLEKTEKALKDTQAWGTKNAQQLAELKKEADERKRQAQRPAILDANPELEQAIRYVSPQAEQPKQSQQEQWMEAVNRAHPGIFDASIDPDLEQALMKRLSGLGDAVHDPLVAIREITEEKVAHTERMIGKRFAAESAKAAQKSAMAMPGAGASGSKSAPDTEAEARNRILNMSPADFDKERRKVLGY